MPITTQDAAAHAREMLGDLYQLIEALDRRVPRIERIGEAQIVRDAAESARTRGEPDSQDRKQDSEGLNGCRPMPAPCP